jgi:3-hydroxyisobutyrate dehydrogenase-like beta-hydroxyacid dehydrogenase
MLGAAGFDCVDADVVGVNSGSDNAAPDGFLKQLLERRFDHGFRLALMAKDVRLNLTDAQHHGVPMVLRATVGPPWGLTERHCAPANDPAACARMLEARAGTSIAGREC